MHSGRKVYRIITIFIIHSDRITDSFHLITVDTHQYPLNLKHKLPRYVPNRFRALPLNPRFSISNFSKMSILFYSCVHSKYVYSVFPCMYRKNSLFRHIRPKRVFSIYILFPIFYIFVAQSNRSCFENRVLSRCFLFLVIL